MGGWRWRADDEGGRDGQREEQRDGIDIMMNERKARGRGVTRW